MIGLPKPEAVIFDWDDTLVDTWPVVRSAINATLTAMGHAPWSEAEARQNIGPPARVLFSRLFGEERWKAADEIYIAAYKDSIAGKLRAHEGAEAVLKHLAQRGMPMAVVSTKRGPLLRQEAAHLGFDHYFSALVGAGDAEKDKPDAAAVRHALQSMNFSPGPRVWFIGDSPTDMLCAAQAGCTSVLIGTKPPPESLLAQNPPAIRVAGHAALLELFR
jgi:phosphoglycolate phosphatase